MNSRMEQIIGEIEEYIEGCKVQRFNSSNIIVDKETLEELLHELRVKTPEEIKRYQKIISNKEAILADARTKADEILAQAQIQTNELISEHEIMQQAYAQANEVVMIATKQAQEILDHATNDANTSRSGAMQYTADKLRNLEEIISGSIETAKIRTENLVNSLQSYLDVITKDHLELGPQEFEASAESSEETTGGPLSEPFPFDGDVEE